MWNKYTMCTKYVTKTMKMITCTCDCTQNTYRKKAHKQKIFKYIENNRKKDGLKAEFNSITGFK